MSDINNDKKFGKLVESIGKATSRYRKTKKEADGNVSVAKKTVKSAVNSRKKAKLTEEEIKIEKNNIYINVFSDRNNVCRKPYI